MARYALRYKPSTHDGDRFSKIRYPAHGGYPTRERAEVVLAAMPRPEVMEIVELEDE